jgi:membrane protease YdiL (CAAX protease family)
MAHESVQFPTTLEKIAGQHGSRNELFAVLRVRWIVVWLVVGSLVLRLINARTPLTPVALPPLIFYSVITGWLIAQRRTFRAYSWHPMAFSNGRAAAVGGVAGLCFAVAITAFGAIALTMNPAVIPRGVVPFPEHSPLRVVLASCVLVIVVPLTEELLFRGIILNRWRSLFGPRAGVWLTAIAFALLHGAFFPSLVFAVLLGHLYLRSRELWAAIGAHALNNAIAIVWQQWGLPIALASFREMAPARSQMWCMVVLAVGLVGLLGTLQLVPSSRGQLVTHSPQTNE